MTKRTLGSLAACALLGGCAHFQRSQTVQVAGGMRVRLTSVGESFAQAEDKDYVVTESGLTTFRKSGRNFVRWQFAVRLKHPGAPARIRVEEVSGVQARPILDDGAPTIDETYSWTKQSDLIPANPGSLPWLYQPETTLRVFRVSVTNREGKTAVLYQPANFTKTAKDAIRFQMGPEIPG